jgi:hypothetical protein
LYFEGTELPLSSTVGVALVGCQDAQIADDGFRNLQGLTSACTAYILGQDKVHTVTWKDKAGNTSECRDWNRYRTHARSKCRRKETTIARSDKRTMGNRLSGCNRIAHNRADQLWSVWSGFAVFLDEIGFLDQLFRPRLIAEWNRQS